MPQVTFPVARALSMLKMPDFAPLIEYIKATRDESMRKLATANEPNFMFKFQGEVKAMNDFLDLVERSAELVQKTRG